MHDSTHQVNYSFISHWISSRQQNDMLIYVIRLQFIPEPCEHTYPCYAQHQPNLVTKWTTQITIPHLGLVFIFNHIESNFPSHDIVESKKKYSHSWIHSKHPKKQELSRQKSGCILLSSSYLLWFSSQKIGMSKKPGACFDCFLFEVTSQSRVMWFGIFLWIRFELNPTKFIHSISSFEPFKKKSIRITTLNSARHVICSSLCTTQLRALDLLDHI